MRINFNNAHKLRAGHTVWRCMLTGREGARHVYVQETLLAGSKTTRVVCSMFPENVPGAKRKVLMSSRHIGPKDGKIGSGNYLNDIHGHGAKWIGAFTTRREALRWKAQVEEGVNAEAIEARAERDEEDRRWDDLMSYDDYYDPFYDYSGPDNEYEPPAYQYTEPMTLGELLRKKLAEQEANDDRFALPA